MRKLTTGILTAAILIAIGNTAPADAAWVCGLKKGKELSLRSCPKAACSAKDTHPNNTKVDALKSSGTFWIYVRVKKTGKKGWMSEHYLCGDDIDFG